MSQYYTPWGAPGWSVISHGVDHAVPPPLYVSHPAVEDLCGSEWTILCEVRQVMDSEENVSPGVPSSLVACDVVHEDSVSVEVVEPWAVAC
jgi:hypothetical protein